MDKQAMSKADLTALLKRTDKENPKPQDLAELRTHLDQNSLLVEVNETSKRAFQIVIGSHTKSELLKELYTRQIEVKRKALDYESENLMVQMLINQLILCHIRLNTFEGFHAQKLQESHSTEQGLYWDKVLSNYQRRFLKACESLAKVKKLLSEPDLKQARNKRSQGILASAKL